MSLKPGIYTLKNRSTGYYVLSNDGTQSGQPVQTENHFGNEIPPGAALSVNIDVTGLYTIKSNSNLCIADSGQNDSQGKRWLKWAEGDYKWRIQSASPGLWTIQRANDPGLVADNFDIGNNVIISSGTASETRWEFSSAGF